MKVYRKIAYTYYYYEVTLTISFAISFYECLLLVIFKNKYSHKLEQRVRKTAKYYYCSVLWNHFKLYDNFSNWMCLKLYTSIHNKYRCVCVTNDWVFNSLESLHDSLVAGSKWNLLGCRVCDVVRSGSAGIPRPRWSDLRVWSQQGAGEGQERARTASYNYHPHSLLAQWHTSSNCSNLRARLPATEVKYHNSVRGRVWKTKFLSPSFIYDLEIKSRCDCREPTEGVAQLYYLIASFGFTSPLQLKCPWGKIRKYFHWRVLQSYRTQKQIWRLYKWDVGGDCWCKLLSAPLDGRVPCPR